jgi:hypothetical protein
MSDPTPTRELRDAIKQAMADYHGTDVKMIDDALGDIYVSAIAEAVKAFYAERGMHLTRKPKSLNELLYNAEADAVIAEQNDMIAHVHSVTGYEPDMGGNGKWEKAIKYLVKVKKENGWDIATLWKMMHETETVNGREQAKYWAFEKDRISYGSLMRNPYEMLDLWMPRAYADAKPEEEAKEIEPTEFQQVQRWSPAPEKK